jgi:hypothetical protein
MSLEEFPILSRREVQLGTGLSSVVGMWEFIYGILPVVGMHKEVGGKVGEEMTNLTKKQLNIC